MGQSIFFLYFFKLQLILISRNLPIEEEDDTYACVELSDTSKLRTKPTAPVEDEDDTYACVELSGTSKLRTKPTVPVTNKSAEYSTMSECQRQHHMKRIEWT